MITTEQIEAEIDRLGAEIQRRFTEVRGLFADVASLRTEAELFKKLLEIRIRSGPPAEWLSFLLLGYVRDETDQPTGLWAVTWTGQREAPSDLRLHLRRGWQAMVAADALSYFSNLVSDWEETIETSPAALLARLWELSVGPLRIIADGKTQKRDATAMLRDQFGDFETFPG